MKKYLPILKKCPLFHHLADDDILSALSCINAKLYKKQGGEYILCPGDTAKSMGIVLSGSLLVMQEDIWGHRNIISKITPGGLFAEPFAVLPGAVMNIGILAEKNTEFLFPDMSKIMSLCPNTCPHHSQIINNLIQILSQKILFFNDKITHMSKRTTREKLLSYLSAESVRQGSLSFDIPYNRQQLADFLAVERSAMSFELSKLQKDGLLTTKRNHFVLSAKNSPDSL